MEDRAIYHPVIFAISLLCMILSFALIGLSLYLLPHILFDMTYEVPEFFFSLTLYYRDHHDLSGFLYVAAIFAPPVIGGVILGYIAKLLTDAIDVQARDFSDLHYVDDKLHDQLAKKSLTVRTSARMHTKKAITLQLALKFGVLILAIGAIIYIAEYFIIAYVPK